MRTAVLSLVFLTACSTPPPAVQPDIPPPHTNQSRPVYRVPPTDDAASQAFLEQEIQRKGKPPEPPPSPRLETEVVYRDRYVVPQQYQQPVDLFPWATAYGASVGALIGSASHDTGEGAAIGAGIGFLFDIGRWASY